MPAERGFDWEGNYRQSIEIGGHQADCIKAVLEAQRFEAYAGDLRLHTKHSSVLGTCKK